MDVTSMKGCDGQSELFSVMMSSEEEQSPEEPVWQSVLMFSCKGVIEGIIVLLFLWLLVQVLFTKHLEVHLQVLLTVGLVLLCLTLILGCVLCWCRSRHQPPDDKKDVTSPPPPESVDQMTLELSPAPSSGTTVTKLPYEELDGDVLDNPSVFESSTPSVETFTSAVSEVKQKVCFQMRRLSSPTISTSTYRPMTSSRSSLPSFPKLFPKTRKESHCDEHRRLTVPGPGSPYSLSSLQTHDQLGEEHLLPNYGSNSRNTSFLHFTLTFASMQNTLTVTLVGITGKVCSLDEVTIQVRLHPLHPEPLSQTDELHEMNMVVHVGSLEELKGCVLRLSVFSQDQLMILLGEVDVCCGGLDWIPDMPVPYVRELRQFVDQTERVTL